MSVALTFFTILSAWALWATLVFALPFLRKEKDYHRAALYIILMGATAGVVSALKIITNVPRPEGGLVEAVGSAFPSGHAAMGFFPLGFYWSFSSWRVRGALFVYGVLVAYSRLALNVHFPIDTVAGALIGFGIPYAFMRWEKPFEKRWKRLMKRL